MLELCSGLGFESKLFKCTQQGKGLHGVSANMAAVEFIRFVMVIVIYLLSRILIISDIEIVIWHIHCIRVMLSG